MSAARDYQPLPAILLDCDWSLAFLFFGTDESQTYDFPVGSTFDLTLAPAGVAKPVSGAVITVSGAAVTSPALNHVAIAVAYDDLKSWAPGTYDVQLRRTGPSTVFEPLYVGSVSIFTGLSQVAASGGGGKHGRIPGAPGSVQIFRDSDQVHVVRGEAAGAGAAAYAAWQAIDPVVTALTQVVKTIAPASQQTLFAASASDQVRWARNRGPGDATLKIGGAATGDLTTERQLLVGEEYRPPYRSGLLVSAWSTDGTTIEGEFGT